MKETKSYIFMGTCPTCKAKVTTRDAFDMVVLRYNSKLHYTYYHRACNTAADHSKDK